MKKTSLSGRHFTIFLFAAALLFTIISCKEKDKDIVKPKTVTDIILENNDFTILREIIETIKMKDELRSSNLTFFAPTDNAFRSKDIYRASDITSLGDDSARNFINNHVIKGMIEYNKFQEKKYAAVSGSITAAKFSTSDTTLTFNGALVVLRNLNADNGIIHVVDRTLKSK